MAQLDDEGDLWERRFTFGKGEVRILEDWAGESGLGGSVWDPSITLCRYLDSDEIFPAGFWHGKRVLGGLQYRETRLRLSHNLIPTRTARPSHVSLMPHVEVGSGCGLLGIFAAKLGATVALTDQPYVLPNLERNVNLNLEGDVRSRVSVLPLSWGTSALPATLLTPPLDFILAAECLYMGRVAPLLETLSALSGPDTQVLVCGIVGDGTAESFQSLVGNYFTTSVVPNMRRFGNSHDELPATRALYVLKKRPVRIS